MTGIWISEAAQADLVALAALLTEERGEESAYGFLDSARKTVDLLSSHPLIGAQICSDGALAKIRSWKVRGFASVAIFYLPRQNGITVTRVLRPLG